MNRSYTLGEFVVEPEKCLLTHEGKPVHLAHRPFQVLLHLLENRDRVVSKSELLDKFWDGHDVYEVALSKCIGAIRKALTDRLSAPRFIETRWADGYRYIGPFEDATGDAGSRPLSSARTSLMSEGVLAVAILPFVNTTSDPQIDYLSEGIAESAIGTLSKLSRLRVMAWSTVSRYKDRHVDPREVGSDLGVCAVLTGRMTQVGPDLIIKTELVDAQDGSYLWGDNCSYKMSDILDIETHMCRELSDKLLHGLTAQDKKQLTTHQTNNVEAYYSYLKGRYFLNKRTTRSIKKAVEYFQQAIELDPDYALAYAGLSDSCTLLVSWEALTPSEGYAKAKAAALRAIEIVPTLAEAHAGLGHARLHSWEWADAEAAFKRAVELNPGYAPAHQWYSEYLFSAGRFEESIAEILIALELDPLSPLMNADVGWTYYFARRYDEAIARLKQTIEMDPDFWLPHFIIGQAYIQKEMYDAAIGAIHKAMELAGKGPLSVLLVGYAYAVSGKRTEALEVIDQLIDLSRERYFSQYRVADIYAGLGDDEKVFEHLERAFEAHDARLIWLKVDPHFDRFRSDPRFQDLARRMGFAE